MADNERELISIIRNSADPVATLERAMQMFIADLNLHGGAEDKSADVRAESA